LIQYFRDRINSSQVLDVGCGSGGFLSHLASAGFTPERMVGIDALAGRINTARRAWPGFRFEHVNAQRMPFDDAAFDLVIGLTLFSSILDDQLARAVATEMVRVLKPGGAIGWYDVRVNNPFNPNTRPYTKRDIANLFPGFELHLRSITLAPPIARRLGPLTPVLYPALAAIPPLRTHYLGLLTRRA
jgi:ubiquinone/menaquinone biosynthesis C-methylase UbiE